MSRIWVKSVAPNNLHGFRVNQLVLSDLTEGLNVVFASNASGKSTLAKAIVNLFQPEYLDAEATINGVVWDGAEFVSLARRRREAKFGGFPGKTKDYYLDLQSLLQGFGQDAHVQELLAKGFKFADGAKQTPIDRSKDVKDTRQLLQDLKDSRRRKQSLLGDEQKLPEMARLVVEAEEAQSNADALQVALQQIELHRRKAELDAGLLELFRQSPGIDSQAPAQAGEFDQGVRNLRRLRSEEVELQNNLRRVGVEFAPDRDLAEADRVRLEAVVDELKDVRVLRKRIESELASANTALIQERDRIFRLAPKQDLNELPRITEGQFQEILRVADLADESRERKARGEGYRAALTDWSAEDDLRSEDLDRAQRRLLEWLEFEHEGQSLPLLPAAIIAVAVCLMAALDSLPFRILVGLIGLAVGGFLYWKGLARQVEKPDLSGLPGEFQPAAFDHRSVADILTKISKVKARQEVADRLQTLAQSAAVPNEEWHRVVAALDLKVEDPYRLRLVVEAASHYLDGCRSLARFEQELEECSDREGSLKEELSDLYSVYRFPIAPEREVESLDVFLSWFEVSSELDAKAKEIEAEKEILERFLDRQGVPSAASIRERIECFSARLKDAERVQTLRKSLAEIGSQLSARSFNLERVAKALGRETEFDPETLILDEVEAEIERQRFLATELEGRRRRYQDLLVEIRQAEESGTIEQHERSYRSGLARVEARWEAASRDAVKYRISEVIRERLMTEDLPPVLETANDHLYRFSVGRYRLEFAKSPDDALGVITVNDLLEGKTQSYSKLSSGTRVHVLLALRLALIEEQENLTSGGQMKFPVLVDEAMALSDPESSRAVAEALILISRERQVVVFTSQDRDVSLLKHLLPEVSIHGLNQNLTVPEHVDSGLSRTLLAPVGHRFDPRFPVGAHSAASIFGPAAPNGGQRLDQISLDARSSSVVSGLERARRELVHRYPRLNWNDCSEQKWAQTAFAPRLQEFLDECCGCPHRFLAALVTHRGQAFNINQLDAARDWLEEEGYLIEPVNQETLTDLLVRNLEDQDRETWESTTVLFGEAFIPEFDKTNLDLPTSIPNEKGGRSLVRKSRRQSQAPAEGGLFDDFFAS